FRRVLFRSAGEGIFIIIVNFLHGMQSYTRCKFAPSAKSVKLYSLKKCNGVYHYWEFSTNAATSRVRAPAALSSLSPEAFVSKYCAVMWPAASSVNSQNPSVTHFLLSAEVS